MTSPLPILNQCAGGIAPQLGAMSPTSLSPSLIAKPRSRTLCNSRSNALRVRIVRRAALESIRRRTGPRSRAPGAPDPRNRRASGDPARANRNVSASRGADAPLSRQPPRCGWRPRRGSSNVRETAAATPERGRPRRSDMPEYASRPYSSRWNSSSPLSGCFLHRADLYSAIQNVLPGFSSLCARSKRHGTADHLIGPRRDFRRGRGPLAELLSRSLGSDADRRRREERDVFLLVPPRARTSRVSHLSGSYRPARSPPVTADQLSLRFARRRHRVLETLGRGRRHVRSHRFAWERRRRLLLRPRREPLRNLLADRLASASDVSRADRSFAPRRGVDERDQRVGRTVRGNGVRRSGLAPQLTGSPADGLEARSPLRVPPQRSRNTAVRAVEVLVRGARAGSDRRWTRISSRFVTCSPRRSAQEERSSTN